jgi:hypothetical protein
VLFSLSARNPAGSASPVGDVRGLNEYGQFAEPVHFDPPTHDR